MDKDLLHKYLAGEATDEERERLRAALEADPSLADALFEAAELERDLAEVHRSAAIPRRRLWIGVSAAAALLAAAAVYYFAGDSDAPRVESVEGTVSPPSLAAGERLSPGQDLSTSRGRLVLRYDDGTRVELGAGTSLRDLGGDKSMSLLRGTLTADVVKQPDGKAMVIRTPQGEARVVGTRFTLAARSGSTRLAVEKGQVRLTRLSDGKSAEVTTGQFAVAGPGAGPAALSLAPRSWLSVPGTAMSQVVPDPKKFPKVQAVSGPSAVIGAWSGGALDTRRNRIVLWGGGYSDYHGNELYAFSAETLTWERLTDPTPDPRLSQETNDDGTPNSRATFNGLAYLAHVDRFFAIGGSVSGSGYGVCRTPWTFDFDAKRWFSGAPSPSSELGGACAFDPATRKIWWGDTKGLYSHDLDAGTWTKHNEDRFYYQTGTVDTKRGQWILVGDGQVFSYDLRSGKPVRIAWKTAGADSVVAKGNPGVDYDPVRDRIVAWAGGPVCTLDPETKTWTTTDAPGAPKVTTNGIFGRWRYVPGLDAFILVTAIDQNVHFYKP